MDALASPDILVFESFRLDPRRGCLLKQDQDGAYRPVAIGSRTLDVLSVLADRPGILLRRDEIMAAAWPGTVVEDNNLAVQISALRRILDRDRAEGSCIQTIPGRGYRFVAPVTRLEIPAPPVGGSSDNDAEGALAEGCQPQRTVGPSGPRVTPINLPRNRKRGWGGLLTAVAGALSLSVAAVAASNWHFPWWTSPGSVPRLSMVVLPFANLSKDPDQQYFADGITEDLMTDLSRFANMLVISRNAAFSYRNKPVDEKQIGHDLRVRYVLEGSVQRLGDRVRVNAQLVDAETNRTLWADRFDSGMGDLPALQNEVTSRLANALTVGLITAEAARPIKDPDAVDYLLRGYAATSKALTRGTRAEAISMFERALTLDPQYAAAQSGLASALAGRAMDGMADSPAADIVRAEGLANQALAAAPGNAGAHYAKGQVLRAQAQVLRGEGRCEEAIAEYEMAISFDRNLVFPMTAVGWCKLYTGSIEEVIPRIEQAVRLSPRSNSIPIWYQWIGQVHLLQSQVDEAVVWLEKARNVNPAHPLIRANLASAYALKGETERAAAELAEARRLSTVDRFSSMARLEAVGYFGVPRIRSLYETTYLRGLRLAGVPE